MTPVEPAAARPPFVSNTTLAVGVYALYFIGYFTGLTNIVGVAIAHAQIGTADPVARSHFAFQIRTFWVGLLYFTGGIALFFTVILMPIGIALIVWWFIWSLIRNVCGLLAFNEHRAIANPTSWKFG